MEIRPLRAYRYAGDAARDISAVVAPPYDQISPEMQDRLYAMSPHNIVRVTYPKEADDKYRGARRVLEAWLAEGVWRREDRPAVYPYHQTYPIAGQPVTRMGFVALGEVSDYARGVVLPHERTHAGPKRDRMDLLEATAADIGLLFMLTSDPSGELRRLTTPAGEPIAEARDLKGELHRLWRVTDEALFTVRPGAPELIRWPERTSPAWRGLAVSILHEGLLRPLLGITDAKLDAKTHVDYTADRAEAIQLARDGKYQAAFLIAPTTAEELQAVVRGGELLPQKSTHFYPKLLDGLVFHRLGE